MIRNNKRQWKSANFNKPLAIRTHIRLRTGSCKYGTHKYGAHKYGAHKLRNFNERMLVQRNAKSRMVKKCTETSTKISRNVSSTCRWYKLNYYQLQLQPVYRHVETPLKGTVTSRVSGIRTVCTEVRCQLPSTKNNNNCCGLICTGRKE